MILVVVGFCSGTVGFSSCFTIFSPSFLAILIGSLTGSFFIWSFAEGLLVVLTTFVFFTVVVDFLVVFFAALVFTPRAFFTRELQLISDLDDQLNFMIEQKFNPEIKSIVEHKQQNITYNPDSEIKITYWSPDKMELDVSTPTSQFLILSEI